MLIAGDNPLNDVRVSGITWDGNGQNATGGLSMTNARHRLVDVRFADHFEFDHNKVINAINWSVFVSNSANVWIDHNEVYGGWSNTYDQNDGYHVRSSQRVFVMDNYCNNADNGGTGGDDCIVFGSAIAESDRDMAFAVAEGNVVAGGWRAILVFQEGTTYNTRNILIDHNQIQKAKHGGILVQKIGNIASTGKLLDITVADNNVTDYNVAGTLPGDGIGIESTSSVPLDFYENVSFVGNTISGSGSESHDSAGIGNRGNGRGFVANANNLRGLVAKQCIQVGTASAPNTDAVITNNNCDQSGTTGADNVLGLFTYGLSRSVIAGNQFKGAAGADVCMYMAAAATAGNDTNGIPRAETSTYNSVNGNSCY